MSSSSRVEGFLIREHVDWAGLVRALGEILGVDPSGIRPLDVEHLSEPPAPVLVECHGHASGFRLDVTLYLGTEVQSGLAGVPLARRLAMALGQEVLTSPPAEAEGLAPPPDLWVLACPDDSLFLVRQLAPESDDVEIDPRHMQPLPVPARGV
jgi:hypothetical protein